MQKGNEDADSKLPISNARNYHYAKMLLNFSQNYTKEHILKV